MQGLNIELPWMLTVVGVMCFYGILVLAGVAVRNGRAKDNQGN
jgi:hypothetical protein